MREMIDQTLANWQPPAASDATAQHLRITPYRELA